MKTKDSIYAVITVVVGVALVLLFSRTSVQTSTVSQDQVQTALGNPSAPTVLDDLEITNSLVVDGTLSVAGAITFTGLPTFGSSGFSNNGEVVTVDRATLTQGTTTPCAILSPAATTTLTQFSLNLTYSTSSATTWSIGTTTTNSAYATSTSLASESVASGVKKSFSRPATALDNSIIGPSSYVTVGVAGLAAPSSYAVTGTCTAEFTGM